MRFWDGHLNSSRSPDAKSFCVQKCGNVDIEALLSSAAIAAWFYKQTPSASFCACCVFASSPSAPARSFRPHLISGLNVFTSSQSAKQPN
eukprot:1545930-Rhodomonas_salina.1